MKYIILFFFLLAPGLAFGQTINYEWTSQFGGSNDDIAQAVDSTGNIYIAGITTGALSGQINLGLSDAFVRKYSSDGAVLWTRQFGTSVSDSARTVQVDATGVYVSGDTSGAFSGQANFGGTDVFLVKFDFSGNVLWTRQFGASGNENNRGGLIQDSRVLYVAGATDGTFSGQTNSGGTDAFVAKYDQNGNLLWITQFGTSEYDDTFGITFGASAVYVGGGTEGTFSGETSSGGGDALITKLNADGAVLWIRQFGTSGYDIGSAIVADSSGVYAGGFTESAFPGKTNPSGGDAFIAKYDHIGNQAWLTQFGTNFDIELTQIVLEQDRLYAVGQVDGALPGETELGAGDAYIAVYNTSGVLVWLEQFGTLSFDKATDVSVDGFSVYISGYTTGEFSGQTSSGQGDAFLRKYKYIDFDGDGIYDNIDTAPTTFSNEFSDIGPGGTTTGTITSRGGQILTLEDAASPANGVLAKASSSGSGAPAKITACGGGGKIFLYAGSGGIFTFSSGTV